MEELEAKIRRLKDEKNRLLSYIAIREDLDYKEVCAKFDVLPE